MIDQDILKYRERIFILSVLAAFYWLAFSIAPVAVEWIGAISPWAQDTLLHNDAVKMFITLPIICCVSYPAGVFLSNLIMLGLPIGNDN